MSECVVRMEMPKEGCHTCDARCVSALYGYICGIERKNVMPFLGKKNRPDWCPIICSLPDGHGTLIDLETAAEGLSERYNSCHMTCGAVMQFLDGLPTIVPAERSEEK